MEEIDSEHKKPRIYEELTLEVLANTPDDELHIVITDYILTKFDNAQNAEMRLEIIKSMSPGFQIAWSTWELWWAWRMVASMSSFITGLRRLSI